MEEGERIERGEGVNGWHGDDMVWLYVYSHFMGKGNSLFSTQHHMLLSHCQCLQVAESGTCADLELY